MVERLDARALRALVPPGARVAVGDGAGAPAAAMAALADTAAAAGGVSLLLGWLPGPFPDAGFERFASVRTLMGGYALRAAIDCGSVRYLPVRLGATPALLRGPLRIDLLVCAVRRRRDGGWGFTSEVSWQRAAVDAGAAVAGVAYLGAPLADGGPALPDDRFSLIGEVDTGPAEVRWGPPGDADRAIAERVAARVPAGARVQVPPGPLGGAVLDALTRPVLVDSGVLNDAVVDLDRRRLVLGRPMAPYVAGGAALYDWADGRGVAMGVEVTHEPGRLAAGAPLVAVNTALQVDLDGQVNVESAGGSAIAGIGGQPDYAFAAAASAHGTSILALPTARRGHPTLVEHLDGPVSTPAHDVDVVVTENGEADLRGLDRPARRAALAGLWER